MEDGVAERLEDRAALVERRVGPADHHEQFPRSRLVAAAADRRIDDVQRREVVLESEAGGGVHGAVDHDDRAVGHRRQRAVGPRRTSSTPASSTTQMHSTSDAAPSSAGDAAIVAADAGERLEGLGPAGPQRGRVAGVDDPLRHGSALAAEADEPDAGHGICSAIIRCM